MTQPSATILSVRDLHTQFVNEYGTTRAVDGVSFDLRRGEILGLVGESGCGKSVTSLSIMGLLPAPQGRITQGDISFQGSDLTRLSQSQRRKLRGRHMAMVFQDPMSTLNPYLRVDEQLTEALRLHLALSRQEALKRATAMLKRVGIPDPRARIHDFPHQLSGGMRQRVMLAMALLCDPELLILDEPTTALDVTVQAQILDLLSELRAERKLSAIFITHDLGVVAQVCDRVLVMYAGRIVEEAGTEELFKEPYHPYTRALLESVPRLSGKTVKRLATIEGLPPRLDQGPFESCRFVPRCPFVKAVCREREPDLEPVRDGHLRRCVLGPEELSAGGN